MHGPGIAVVLLSPILFPEDNEGRGDSFPSRDIFLPSRPEFHLAAGIFQEVSGASHVLPRERDVP
jgi:hypothetical protein